MTNLERVYNFIDEVKNYSLATVDGDQPRVRIFGTILCYDGKLFIQTGKKKDVAKQIYANPKAEIISCKGTEWLRVTCELVENDNRDIRVAMLDKMPSLRSMYNEDDGNMVMFEIKNATATFSSFTSAPEVLKF